MKNPIILCLLSMVSLTSCQSPSDNEDYLSNYFGDTYQEWKKAGAQPQTSLLPEVSIGDISSLQHVIDSLHEKQGGIITLSNGIYTIGQSINIRDNIFLKGENRDSTIIISEMRHPFVPSPFETPCTVEFMNIENAGISNLTLDYRAVDFPPYHPKNFYDLWDTKTFKNDPNGDTLLYVGHLGIKKSAHISIDQCNVLNAGTDPMIIAGSQHVTVSNSYVSGSYNKGGKGNGYLNIDKGSHHVLVKGCKIEKIRHLSIQMDTYYNVIYNNYLEVDVNFHNGDAGYNLIEGNTIRIPEWHGWHCFSAGAESLHQPPGPQNYLFNNFTQYKFHIPSLRPKIAENGDSIIYKSMTIFDTVWVNERPLIRYEYGEIKESQSTNRIYVMNDKWDSRKSVLLRDTLTLNKIL